MNINLLQTDLCQLKQMPIYVNGKRLAIVQIFQFELIPATIHDRIYFHRMNFNCN